MAITPGMVINAPEPGRRRYGLFDAAVGPLDLPTHAQAGGVKYVPQGCGDAYAYPVVCDTTPPNKPIDGDDELIETGVFAVLSTLACTQVGYTLAELENKVLRRLEGSQQAAVERVLSNGLDFEGNALPDVRSLTDVDAAIPFNFDPDDATVSEVVGALEKYAYTTQGYGFQAVIHAPVEVAAFAFREGLVLSDGPKKVTPMGSIWSFGAYESGSAWITGQTTVWQSPVTIESAFDRVTNERLLLAERTYAVGFDCFAGRVSYDPLEVVSP